MPYNGATICLNRHVVSKTTANSQKYCSQCGAETFSDCPYCHAPIHGLYDIPGVVVLYNRPYSIPSYCYECGKPYPWTEKILSSAVELISLEDGIDDDIKELIRDSIPDLIVNTPSTPLATAKYRKGIAEVGETLKNSLRNLLIDVISETAKKALFPD